MNASEELTTESLHEPRAEPARELVAIMKFLNQFPSTSEELAAFQKERRQSSKQEAAAKQVLRQR